MDFFTSRTVEDIRQCVNRQLDINKRNNLNRTPFIHHCRRDDKKLAFELIRQGCDVTLKTPHGHNGLVYACLSGNLDFVEELMSISEVCSTLTVNCLLASSVHGHIDVFDFLVRKNSSLVDQQSDNGFSPLMIACQNRQLDIVDRILQHSVNVNQQDHFGRTALHYLSCTLHGPDISDMKSRDTKEYRTAISDRLFMYGADCNIESAMGNTPLHTASENGFVDLVEKFINYGANVNASSSFKICPDGMTPLAMAKTKEIRRLLKAAGGHY